MCEGSVKSTSAALLLLFVSTLTASYARSDDRITEKARDAVENASPDDWYTLAVSAAKCLEKKVNLEEAERWLDRSLKIAETPFNLELKGDYYFQNQLPDKAIEYYVRTMNILKEKDGEAKVSHIQMKIARIIKFGGNT